MRTLTIGAVARRANVTPEAIRYYERMGVLEEAPRNASGYRQYPPRVLEELRLLKAAQAVGFSLEDIAGMLALMRADHAPCREMCGMAERQIEQLNARINALEHARDLLAAALAACSGDGGACVVPGRLAALTDGATRDDAVRFPAFRS